jgi:hypothetical protein
MDKVTFEFASDRDLADKAERLGVELPAEAERMLRRRLGPPAAVSSSRLTPSFVIEGRNMDAHRQRSRIGPASQPEGPRR